MSVKLPQIHLDLLNRLVDEVKSSIEKCEKMKTDDSCTQIDFITEMSKASGLFAGIAQESTSLIFDVQEVIKKSQQPAQAAPKGDILSQILGGFGKGGTNSN